MARRQLLLLKSWLLSLRKPAMIKYFSLATYANQRYKVPVFLYTFPIIYAINDSKNYKQLKSVKEAINESDSLFDGSRFKESYAVLIDYKDTDNEEILWRISRALYNMTKVANVTEEEVKELVKEADEYINRALSLNAEHYAVHKWFAIILNARTTLEGTKAKIASLLTFKKHIQRAIELNPSDPTSMHMLGTYYYNLADLAWYQKKLASALFGTVPESSFEEALAAFNEAEKTSPNFYSLNLLMLGKTYLKLGMPESAAHWLQRAALYIPKSDEDKSVVKEATELLKSLKPTDKNA